MLTQPPAALCLPALFYPMYTQDAYRQLVVKWILDTERSYLQALQTVIKVCVWCLYVVHVTCYKETDH